MGSQSSQPSEYSVRSYRDLGVWQKAVALTKKIYLLTQQFPQQEIYGLTSQLRRASVSIPSNIAEGQSRRYSREFTQFLHVAIGSVAEVDIQLLIASELGYISKDALERIEQDIQELRRMLYGLVRSLPDR